MTYTRNKQSHECHPSEYLSYGTIFPQRQKPPFVAVELNPNKFDELVRPTQISERYSRFFLNFASCSSSFELSADLRVLSAASKFFTFLYPSFHHSIEYTASWHRIVSSATNNGEQKLCCPSLLQELVPLVAAILVAEGFSRAAAIAGPCSGSLSSMSICLPSVEGDNPPSPTDACCAIIRNTDTGCLCNIITAYSNSMGINLHASLLLPKQCKKVIPSGYTCDGYMVPSYVPPANRKLMSV